MATVYAHVHALAAVADSDSVESFKARERLIAVCACRLVLDTLAMQAGSMLAAQHEEISSAAATALDAVRQSADPSVDHMLQASMHQTLCNQRVCTH